LILTSPSVNSRYPTTEPRLRVALTAVEHAGRVPVISEVDLFLRLCPAVTVGVTGTKGKTTTASLAAAILEAGARPVVLGGNIGLPLVDRLPELTAEHRVVLELSELQLPTLSRGTHVAVYTHVTEDHLDRHGSVAAYRAAKRRLAELVDPDGALVLNAEDPVSGAYAGLGTAPPTLYRRDEPLPGGVGVHDGWIVLPCGRLRRRRVAGPTRRTHPAARRTRPGAHISNVLAASRSGSLRHLPMHRRWWPLPGVEHRLSWSPRSTACATSTTRRGPSRMPSRRPCGASADCAHRGPRQGHRPHRLPRSSPTRRRGRSHRQAAPQAAFRAAGLARAGVPPPREAVRRRRSAARLPAGADGPRSDRAAQPAAAS
jgi:hypothetical protein